MKCFHVPMKSFSLCTFVGVCERERKSHCGSCNVLQQELFHRGMTSVVNWKVGHNTAASLCVCVCLHNMCTCVYMFAVCRIAVAVKVIYGKGTVHLLGLNVNSSR